MSINSFAAHVGSDNQNVKMSPRTPRKSEALQEKPAWVRDQPVWILNALHRKGDSFKMLIQSAWKANFKLPAQWSGRRSQNQALSSGGQRPASLPSLPGRTSPSSACCHSRCPAGPQAPPTAANQGNAQIDQPPGCRSAPRKQRISRGGLARKPPWSEEGKRFWVNKEMPDSQFLLLGPSL